MLVIEGDSLNNGKIMIPVHAIQCVMKRHRETKWYIEIYTGYGLTTTDEFDTEAEADKVYNVLKQTLENYGNTRT